MSSTIDKLVAKGKAKVKEFRDQPQTGWQGQSHPSQQQYQNPHYPPSQYPPQNYNYQQAPPPPANYQQQWASYPPQHQQSYSPPIPLASKPQSTPSPAPPIPPNRPTSTQPPPPPQNNMPPPPPNNMSSSPADTTYWKPSFDDNTPVTQNFRHEIGDHGWGNEEKQMYTSSPANSFHHDNRLIVRGIVSNGSYTSARLTSHQTLSRPRGYLSTTILAPAAEGIWPAYWLLPHDPFSWPTDGEVDIFESWNGDCVNHSCLHWGHYNGEDWHKHRVKETLLVDMASQPHTFGFAWSEEEGIPGWRGRMIWYIDGKPVMRGDIPLGTRRMEDFRILINVAMGGKVCHAKLPRDGYYDLIVSDLKMCAEPPQGWGCFEHVWSTTPEGKTM